MANKAATKAVAKRPAAAPALRRASADPRDAEAADASGDSGEDLTDEQRRALAEDGVVLGAPSTPTTDTVAAALEPGPVGNEGGAPVPDQVLRRRVIGDDVPMTKVESLARGFRIVDDKGAEHEYAAGTTEMPTEHAKHWYAKAHGVVLKK